MFCAYPNNPHQIGDTFEIAIKEISTDTIKVKSWKALDIAGSFLQDSILSAIDDADTIIADISKLNFNVTYEIGYSIGQNKPIILVKNKSLNITSPTIREVGIFDTIGFEEYENSDELIKILQMPKKKSILDKTIEVNTKSPVYLLETKYKTDDSTRITARIKKARLIYRSFDPNETPRLSAYDAIRHVSKSYGVVVPLLSKEIEGYYIHNLRAAFIAGLAKGMGKSLCLLQLGEDPIPLDYRDIVNIYYHPNDIDPYIANFAHEIMEAFQEDLPSETEQVSTDLQNIDLGASSAENEMKSLKYYYLKTDSFRKTARGEYQLVVGRKGSGKSAIFLQVRDRERSKRTNIVLDLKPEGYKLIKFKELVLEFLQEGTFQHTITAFWEYILLLEICHRTLDTDAKKINIQEELYKPYKELEELYKAEEYVTEGDFSERMSTLLERLTISYKMKFGNQENVNLSVPEITSFLYKTDLKNLRDKIVAYLRHKEKVWLLFDNIDKGWPSAGLKKTDLIIIRTLIDAARKLQRDYSKRGIELYPVIFLRNDVYDMLLETTSDRQKEQKVNLDWVDPDLLREVIKLRIQASIDTKSDDFYDIWRSIIVSHYRGEETSQYLIERCLMRPRFLINLLNQCLGFAINFRHEKIEKEDIEKGIEAYSTDVLIDINYEIRDVLPEAEDILFGFLSCNSELTKKELDEILVDSNVPPEILAQVINILLWHGFIGLKINNEEPKYIYNMNYNMKLLNGYIKKNNSRLKYSINPAFWPALLIEN